jgi:hypothetical protein
MVQDLSLNQNDQSDRGDRALVLFFYKGWCRIARNYPHPFIFLGSSTPIAPIAPIATFKVWILRCVFSDRGRMRGDTLHFAPIAFLFPKVSIMRCIFADRGVLRGSTPHSAPIALLVKIRGNTPHRGWNAGICSASTNRVMRIEDE